MENLLPLVVVIPLGAAFLIPMLSLIAAKKAWWGIEAVAVLATLSLVVIALVGLAEDTPTTIWIGDYAGKAELLGLVGRPGQELEVKAVSPLSGRGILVEEVVEGAAAAAAGIEPGDVILGWKAPPARSFVHLRTINELRRQNAALAPGTEFVLKVQRGDQVLERTVVGGKSVTGIAMFSDGLTRLMLVIVSVVSFAAVLFSLNYMRSYTKLHLYYSPILLMIAGMNGIVVSGDLFNIYVFLEVAAVASYALVGFGVEAEELEASFKYLVLSAVASAFILLGIGIVYSLRGTLNLAQIAVFTQHGETSDAMWLAMGFFLAGFGLKAAMVPFHAWLPDAHPSAPAPVSAMLSGVLIKASGVYVLSRLVFNVLGVSSATATVLIGMGIVSMLVGVFLAVGQWDMKRLFAYHSISQMGYVVLALGIAAEALALREGLMPEWRKVAFLALFAGFFHLANHAAFKSLLFLVSGSVVHRTGTRNLKELGGLGKTMPWTSLCARIGALSISGVPPFNGFFSKLLIIIAVVWSGHWVIGALTVLVSFVTLLSFTKVQRYLIEGEASDRLAHVQESPFLMQAAMGILAAACVGLGLLLPLYMGGLLSPAAQAVFGQLLGYARSVFGG